MKEFGCARLRHYVFAQHTGGKIERHPDKDYIGAKSECWLAGFRNDCGTAFTSIPRIEGKVLNGRAINLPKPAYLPAAKADRAEGTIIVLVSLDEAGKVEKAVGVCGGHRALTEASVAAAQKSKFTQTLVGGVPIKTTGVITYNFIR
jgi:TonB family protein